MGCASDIDRKRITNYLSYLVLTGEIEGLATKILNNPKYVALFNERELDEIKKEASFNDLEIPALLLSNDWGVPCVTFTSKYNLKIIQNYCGSK